MLIEQPRSGTDELMTEGKRKGILSLLTIHWPNQVINMLSVNAYGVGMHTEELYRPWLLNGMLQASKGDYNGPKVSAIKYVLETFQLICFASS